MSSKPSISEAVKGSTLMLSPDGKPLVPPELRLKFAILSDGICYLSSANKNDADVRSFFTKLALQGRPPARTEHCSIDDVALVYRLCSAASTVAGEGNNEQATRIREIVTKAASLGATDIHWIGRDGGSCRVQFRCNGLLEEQSDYSFSCDYAVALLRAAYQDGDNPTQLMLNVNQDARIKDRRLLPDAVSSVRVSSGPMSGGFQQVWRLTYGERVVQGDLSTLGYSKKQVRQILLASRLPYGMIVVGGPTGSGKSTTLQNVMTNIYRTHKGKKSLYTIEEPVELPIPGALQHSTVTKSESDEDRRAGFIAETRRMLRSDPDVVMYGEIRDDVTAGVAVRTAMAGRLVITTLHGNTFLDLLLRIIFDLRVEKILATDHTIFVAFVSQSLVPTVCPKCSIPAETVIAEGHHQHDKDDIRRVMTSFPEPGKVRFVGRGCSDCRETGFAGRALVAEVCRTNAKIMDAMREGRKDVAMSHWLSEKNFTKRRVAHHLVNQGRVDPVDVETHVGELAVILPDGTPQDVELTLNYGYQIL